MKTPVMIIWGSMIASMALIAVVNQIILGNPNSISGGLPAEFAGILKITAGVSAAIALISFRYACSETMWAKSFDQGGEPLVLQNFFKFHLFAWAMTEAVVLQGFVIALSQKSALTFYPFFGAALALMVLFYPRLQTVLIFLQKRQRRG